MEVIADKSFEKDFKKVSPDLKKEIVKIYDLFCSLETRMQSSALPLVSILVGHKGFYRYRLGDYRIGFYFKGNILYLSRVLHRKEMYKYFPPRKCKENA